MRVVHIAIGTAVAAGCIVVLLLSRSLTLAHKPELEERGRRGSVDVPQQVIRLRVEASATALPQQQQQQQQLEQQEQEQQQQQGRDAAQASAQKASSQV